LIPSWLSLRVSFPLRKKILFSLSDLADELDMEMI
jgi:hypothetical protein